MANSIDELKLDFGDQTKHVSLDNNMKDWEIDFLCMFSENMSDEEVINIIDEIEAEEEARIELADMAREGWR